MDPTLSTLPTPFRCLRHKRFSQEQGWRLTDVSLSSSGHIAVAGSNNNTDRTSIDLYSDSREKPKLFYSRQYEKYSAQSYTYSGRLVAFLEGYYKIVTCVLDKLEVIRLKGEVVLKSRKVRGKVECLAARNDGIFTAPWRSNKVNMYDKDLNAIKAIIMDGIQDGDYPYDLTVTAEAVFVCTFSWPAKAQSFDKSTGKVLCEFKNATRKASNANSVTVSMALGLVSVLWDWNQILFYALSDNTCILVFECGSSRIRISDQGSFVTGSRSSCEVKMYEMAELFTYTHFKEKLISLLQKEDCLELIKHFAVLREQSDAIEESSTPAKVLLHALEEKGMIDTSNIDRLTDALARLDISSSYYHMAEIYQKTRMQATFYGTFLATLSAHLTASLSRDLCSCFEISEEIRRNIIPSQNPGLSLLLSLNEMNVISSSDVGALEQPLVEFKLLQALAKVHEYQSAIEDENAQLGKGSILSVEEKREFFIGCIQRKIRDWYETMTPVPWKKSCNWRAADLFVGSGLILTRSNSKHSPKDIDEKCKLHYTEILTHESLISELRIILEGDPGSGKTMLVSQLAFDWSQGKFSEIKVLILLPLKFVNSKTLVEAIKEFYFPRQDIISVADIHLFLMNESTPTYLLLDGLEEYNPILAEGEKSEVTKIMSKVTYTTCKVIVTSRSDYVQDLPQYPMLRIGRFGKTERDCYLAKVYSDNMEKQLKIQEVIENTPFILDICSVPLLFVLAVHNVESMEKVQENHLDKVAPFMSNMVSTLCPTSDFVDVKLDLEPQIEKYIRGRSFLERCAYNGLCRGSQQLSWPKKFIDIHVFNSRQWIDSGIFSVEEGFVTADDRVKLKMSETANTRNLFTETEFGKIGDDSQLQDSNVKKADSEIFRSLESSSKTQDVAELQSTAELGSDVLQASGTGSALKMRDGSLSQNAKELVDASDSTAKHFPLHIKFLHKIIQEWFAAKHFSFQIVQLKQLHLQETYLKEHLPFISPTDLHYVLRFTCALYPPCLHLIISHLLRCHRSKEGDIPKHILNCVFLCFAEYDGPITNDVLETVTEVCKQGIAIHVEDSRLLQLAKVSVLELASKFKVPTKTLLLTDLVLSASEDELTFNSGVTLGVLNTLKLIEISRWDQNLEERDYANTVQFTSHCASLQSTILHFPDLPPEINKETQCRLQKNQTTVTWIIGKKLRQIFDTETGSWVMVGEEVSRLTSEIHFNEEAVDTMFSTKKIITKEGGTIRIQNTKVKLQILPDSLPEGMNKCEIYMKIVFNSHLEEPSTSFGSDSSVVVEILPNNLKLRHPAPLTLPHCLQLKGTVGKNVTVLISHHDNGSAIKWERTDVPYQLHEESCTIHLRTFCWVKYTVDDKIVDAKKIQVYTAKRKLLPDDDVTKVDVGYYLNLSGEKEILQTNKGITVEEERPFLFFKEGRHPLNITFGGCLPAKWKNCAPEENPKIISFLSIETSVESSCPFIFEKVAEGVCICTFKVSQTDENIELTMRLKVENDTSVVHSSNLEESQEALSFNQLWSNSAETLSAAVHQKTHWEKRQKERGDDNATHFLNCDVVEEYSRWGSQFHYRILKGIARALDPHDPLGNDWRQLADELGYNMGDINLFQNSQSATLCVIDSAMKSGKLKCYQQLKSVLQKIGRIDAASIIPNEESERSKPSDSKHLHLRKEPPAILKGTSAVTSEIETRLKQQLDAKQSEWKKDSGTVMPTIDSKEHAKEVNRRSESTPITDLGAKMDLLNEDEVPDDAEQLEDTEVILRQPVLEARGTITNDGGEVRIPGTLVALIIPSGALPKGMYRCEVKMRIIPRSMLKEPSTSFSSYSAVVVEILPSNIKLQRTAKIILPHCLLLQEGAEYEAQIFVSKQEEGHKPLWEEQTDLQYHVTEKTCIVWLKSFCWVTIQIVEKVVLAKKLILFTCKDVHLRTSECAGIGVGFYYCGVNEKGEFLQRNKNMEVTREIPFTFMRKGEHPLSLLLMDFSSNEWRLWCPHERKQVVSYTDIAASREFTYLFPFERTVPDAKNLKCTFKVSQHQTQEPVLLTISIEHLADPYSRTLQMQRGKRNVEYPMTVTFQFLSRKVGSKWRNVGRFLRISDDEMDSIQLNNPNNIQETIYQMFQYWKQTTGSGATYTSLIKALQQAGRKDLAEIVENREEFFS